MKITGAGTFGYLAAAVVAFIGGTATGPARGSSVSVSLTNVEVTWTGIAIQGMSGPIVSSTPNSVRFADSVLYDSFDWWFVGVAETNASFTVSGQVSATVTLNPAGSDCDLAFLRSGTAGFGVNEFWSPFQASICASDSRTVARNFGPMEISDRYTWGEGRPAKLDIWGQIGVNFDNRPVAEIPEPATATFMLLGLGLLAVTRGRLGGRVGSRVRHG